MRLYSYSYVHATRDYTRKGRRRTDAFRAVRNVPLAAIDLAGIALSIPYVAYFAEIMLSATVTFATLSILRAWPIENEQKQKQREREIGSIFGK